MRLNSDELYQVLDQQESIMEELLELAHMLTPALSDDDLDRIIDITGQQEDKGREMALLEQKRRQILGDYAGKTDTGIDHLRDLFEHIAPAASERLSAKAQAMRKTHRDLQEAQEQNHLLLKRGIAYTNKILTLLNSRQQHVYGRTGNIEKPLVSTRLDKNI